VNQHPTTEEHHARMAEQSDQAAAALEEELSTTNDARLRHELGEQIRKERETAAFYRGPADKLQDEA
jgi:hypothetical protein